MNYYFHCVIFQSPRIPFLSVINRPYLDVLSLSQGMVNEFWRRVARSCREIRKNFESLVVPLRIELELETVGGLFEE